MVEIEPIITDSQNKSNDNDDIEKNAGQSQPAVAPSNNDLNLVRSHMSHHELHAATSYEEPDDARYDHFSDNRKLIIVAILSYCSFLAPVSSTSILSAVPEVAAEYNSTGTIINISNAIYMLSMGLASSVWGPLSQVWGRRPICIITVTLFLGFSIGTALAPNLAAYFIFRAFSAFPGTSFLVVGSAAIGDIYEPTKRATALAWFLSGTVVGPAFGPFLGGVIVTYASWRAIFWLQSALAALATILVFFLFPETFLKRTSHELKQLPPKQRARAIWKRISPIRVIVMLFSYPNLFFAAVASASLVWNMYSLLAPIRYVLNPRFQLTSPIQSGLFYIAPGCGFIVGTLIGGRWADYTVRKWIRKRNGHRVPEDRLKSCLPFLGVVIPACILVYGWTVDKAVGGIPVPVLAMFLQGVAQLFCFPSLNTYCLDVMQSSGRSAEVVAGNYLFRYIFGALGTAVVLPAIEALGIGGFSTLSAGFLVTAGGLVWVTTLFGAGWRRRVDARKRRKRQVKEDEKEKKREGEMELSPASPNPAAAAGGGTATMMSAGISVVDTANTPSEAVALEEVHEEDGRD